MTGFRVVTAILNLRSMTILQVRRLLEVAVFTLKSKFSGVILTRSMKRMTRAH
jgi:hypothetical protein